MSAITAAEINKLRQATGAGMMDCRKALTETNGDFEAAIDWLRKQGQKVAAKRSDREAKEGVIIAQTSADNKTGFVVCISCETDFVSKNAEFVAFAQTIADAAVTNNVKTVDELNAVSINGTTVADMINDKLASIGEKIAAKLERVDAPYVASYILGSYRMGVLVGLLGTVRGMISSFEAMATAGAPDATALSLGISEALINTFLGIMASAIAIILYNFFNTRIDSMTFAMDEANFTVTQTFASKH